MLNILVSCMRSVNVFIMITFLIGVYVLLQAEHVAQVKSQQSFYSKVHENPFAIVFFYVEDKKDKPWTEKIRKTMREFKAVSDSIYYRNARLRFVAINVGKKELGDLEKEFGIHEIPAFMLFKSGVPVRNDRQQIIALSGFASRDRLKRFINDHLQDDLEEQIRIQFERQEELRDASDSSVYFGVGYPYGYWGPYDPYYPYYYGNYGYPYGGYSNYYAPGVGFGFTTSF